MCVFLFGGGGGGETPAVAKRRLPRRGGRPYDDFAQCHCCKRDREIAEQVFALLRQAERHHTARQFDSSEAQVRSTLVRVVAR